MSQKNIIQIPNKINLKDLPDKLTPNEIFTINNVQYICEYGNPSNLLFCTNTSEKFTSNPEEIDNYFIIRKLF